MLIVNTNSSVEFIIEINNCHMVSSAVLLSKMLGLFLFLFIDLSIFKGKLAGITNCYTRPEIELLIILHKGHYDKFMRSQYKKPSDYCIHELKLGKKIKSKAFISDYFQDPEELVQVLEMYHRVRSDEECTIFSLLK